MAGRDIFVVGASAGGVGAIIKLLGALPRNLEATLFVVMHRRYGPGRSLADSLRLRSTLPVQLAVDGERILRRRVYLAPVDRHLCIERGRVRVEASPLELLYRPSIDRLFRTASQAYGRRVVGVVLSGALNDGTAGLWDIKRRGGVAMVQDPGEATRPEMPRAALAGVAVDYCLPAAAIGRKLGELAAEGVLDARRKARVLIVEDERIVAKNLERRLAELGYEVSGSAGSGEEALALAESAPPDVVLMDINLPGAVNGTEAARLLWERFQVPVVYVTAYADAETIQEVKSTEPYGYVVKPFRAEQIHAAIQIALERRSRETDLAAG